MVPSDPGSNHHASYVSVEKNDVSEPHVFVNHRAM